MHTHTYARTGAGGGVGGDAELHEAGGGGRVLAGCRGHEGVPGRQEPAARRVRRGGEPGHRQPAERGPAGEGRGTGGGAKRAGSLRGGEGGGGVVCAVCSLCSVCLLVVVVVVFVYCRVYGMYLVVVVVVFVYCM